MTLAEELARLGELRESGILTEAEFTRAKFQLLNKELPDAGHKTPSVHKAVQELARSVHDRVFGGVCGGLAKQARVPSWLMRAIFIIGFVCAGIGLIPYIVLWICMPSEDRLAQEAEYSN